ncbi:hypothetical protein F01_460414 [Burkholderia cenocepacia]|nr:hypothetical protein F01_460414 [Burkholderia cenocepacia]
MESVGCGRNHVRIERVYGSGRRAVLRQLAVQLSGLSLLSAVPVGLARRLNAVASVCRAVSRSRQATTGNTSTA